MKWKNQRIKNLISIFIYNRLHSRYIKPFSYDDEKFIKEFKNGFSMMANYCLLIETIISFKKGLKDSNRLSKKAFELFFTESIDFKTFNDKSNVFYKNIRCGILHQGEITKGWKLTRNAKYLFDEKSRTINVIKFGKLLDSYLIAYSEDLKSQDWNSSVWTNFRKKMNVIISNCKYE